MDVVSSAIRQDLRFARPKVGTASSHIPVAMLVWALALGISSVEVDVVRTFVNHL